MKISLAQAATMTGRSRSTILRTIRAGKLSAERDEAASAWAIDLSELGRVFPQVANGHDRPGSDDAVRTGRRPLWSPGWPPPKRESTR
jgi:hypothetical protein